MLKKLILSGMLACTVAAWGYAVYSYFTPEVIPVAYNTIAPAVIQQNQEPFSLTATSFTQQPEAETVNEDRTLSAKAANLAERKVIYYCTESDSDCDYIASQLFPIITKELEVDLFNYIEYQDINALPVQSTNKLKSDYGFANYPAFVIYELNAAGEYTTQDVLEYDVLAPFTAVQLQTWLTEHKVIIK